MIIQADIQQIRSLQQKKYRQKYQQFIVEGEKSVYELLQQKRLNVECIYALPDFLEKFNAKQTKTRIEVISERDLKKISSLKTPNKALAVVEIPKNEPNFSILDQHLCFYLDDLQNPGNVGTILRIADWFGHPAVFVSENTTDVYAPKVVQASMGALFRIPVFEIKGDEVDCPIFAADMEGTPVSEFFQQKRNGLLVIGNEGQGISAYWQSKIKEKVTIPKGKNSEAESLNAAVAAGIFAALIK